MTEEEIEIIKMAAIEANHEGVPKDVVFLGEICIKLHERIKELENNTLLLREEHL